MTYPTCLPSLTSFPEKYWGRLIPVISHTNFPHGNQSKEILTPASVDEHLINEASVFGVRPGKPLFYRVAVSGIKQLTIASKGLPEGVQIDANTGWITGKAPSQSGDYKVTLHAENRKGKSTFSDILSPLNL